MALLTKEQLEAILSSDPLHMPFDQLVEAR
jgi:hypothetical protein